MTGLFVGLEVLNGTLTEVDNDTGALELDMLGMLDEVAGMDELVSVYVIVYVSVPGGWL